MERRKTSRAQSERRRRKFLSDSQSDRDDRAFRREQEALTNKLLRKPLAERDLEESLMIVAKHTPMFLENREKREDQYRERRQVSDFFFSFKACCSLHKRSSILLTCFTVVFFNPLTLFVFLFFILIDRLRKCSYERQ